MSRQSGSPTCSEAPVVVHEYTRIDPDIVIRILRERLEDFRRFEVEALRWLSLPDPHGSNG